MADNLGISEPISREQQQHGIENVIILIFRDSRTKIDQFDDRHVCHNVLLLPSINQKLYKLINLRDTSFIEFYIDEKYLVIA